MKSQVVTAEEIASTIKELELRLNATDLRALTAEQLKQYDRDNMKLAFYKQSQRNAERHRIPNATPHQRVA